MVKIGRQMKLAASTAKLRPGLPITVLGRAIGPHGSMYYGTEIVKRALAAGMVRESSCAEAHCARPASTHRHIWAAS
jgi:hypothetical protein